MPWICSTYGQGRQMCYREIRHATRPQPVLLAGSAPLSPVSIEGVQNFVLSHDELPEADLVYLRPPSRHQDPLLACNCTSALASLQVS